MLGKPCSGSFLLEAVLQAVLHDCSQTAQPGQHLMYWAVAEQWLTLLLL